MPDETPETSTNRLLPGQPHDTTQSDDNDSKIEAARKEISLLELRAELAVKRKQLERIQNMTVDKIDEEMRGIFSVSRKYNTTTDRTDIALKIIRFL